ncbi:TMEM175 family protein [Microlunatus ginsengisoli]|jgi:uncharacterized membrane protein|uniref:DUF1211 domain-containing protein n=1 Tax=Microlunatus ginsengisoli TaxID=363863 RepID=A0ABP6ZU33_9ACTN
MTGTRSRFLTLIASGSSTERIAFFSDAVFAIAMTLLVLELHVPEVEGDGLGTALIALVPSYLAFLLSFAVLGTAWLAHHRKLAVIERFDPMLPRLNLLVLLMVASLPLPTALIARSGDDPLAVSVYAAAIAALGGSLVLLWCWAWSRGLTSPAVSRELFRYVLVQSTVVPVVFAVSIPIAVLGSSLAAELFWLVALPATVLVSRVSTAPHATEQPA